MRRFTTLIGATALLLATTPAVHANIVSFFWDDGGVGTISGGETGPFTVDISKDYNALGHMTLFFEVDSPGTYLINEDIVNNTNRDWSDFHWELFEELGDVTIINVINFLPFTNINLLPDTMAWIDGGVLPITQVMTPQIDPSHSVEGAARSYRISPRPLCVRKQPCWRNAFDDGCSSAYGRGCVKSRKMHCVTKIFPTEVVLIG